MDLKFPTNTTDIIDSIRNAIGRPVEFKIISSKIPCPDCAINPVTDTSVDPFCTTCSGVGYLITYSGVVISGHVTWGFSDLPNWIVGGQYVEGDCRVQIKYTPENEDVVNNAKRVIVDGKELTIRKKILRGIPGINRILIDLKQEE